ncbi:MAG TPA: DUF6624 domain-containing protein [Pyrinomonadaceae bacterium]|nr:DUF6624 domain-containing protein [Pyrinomonadaceae bacterium]
MKHTALAALLLLAALVCPAQPARAQEEHSEVRRLAQWAERPGPVKNEELRREILRMVKEDQAVRAFQFEGRGPTEAEARAVKERDEATTKRLSEILDRHGFPGVEMVGVGGTRAFITMLVHSPSVELMRRALPHVERAARRGEIPPDDFAMLADDVLGHEGKSQLYGTNFRFDGDKLALQPTQDPARLDERRREIGLPPIAVYVQFIAGLAGKKVDESSLPPARK